MKRAALAIAVAGAGCIVTPDARYSTAASVSNYQVRLQGNLNRAPWTRFLAYRVIAEPLRAGNPTGDAIELYHAIDTSFRARYPTESWEAPNVLRFVSNESSGLPRRRVVLTNHTSQALSYALLQCGDAILILDLPREGRMGLDVPRHCDAAVRGKLADGRVLSRYFPQTLLDRKDVFVVHITDRRIEFD